MRRLRRPPSALLAALLCAGPAAPTPASPSPQQLSGTYQLVDAERKKSEIHRAVDAATEKMRFLQGLARSRLYETSTPLPVIELSFPGDRIRVGYGKSESPIITPADGTPVQWESRFGDVTTVVQTLSDGVLTQHFRGTLGSQRTNTYSLGPEGRRLIVNCVIRSGFIPEPIEFQVVYTRR